MVVAYLEWMASLPWSALGGGTEGKLGPDLTLVGGTYPIDPPFPLDPFTVVHRAAAGH
jgi:hypothetical protein